MLVAFACVCLAAMLFSGSARTGRRGLESTDVERVARGRTDSDIDGATFLRHLNREERRLADKHGAGLVHAEWHEEKDVPVLAQDILEAYRDGGGFALAASGYLDLRGNVWCALLRSTVAVDMVVVRAHDTCGSTARVTRLHGYGSE